MRRAERLFRLVNELQTRRVVKADDLAAALEVSVRTIYRDIAHLQGSGLPIEGEPGVGYLLRPGFSLPNLTFTHDQLDALALGMAFVERTGDPALVSAAKEVRAKLQSSLPDPQLRRLADAPFFSVRQVEPLAVDRDAIRKAIRLRQVLHIEYMDGQGATSSREIHPLLFVDIDDGWMLSSWCVLRQDFRTFRLDRIKRLVVSDTRFDDHPDRNLTAFWGTETCDTND